jgi:hypothetical protein
MLFKRPKNDDDREIYGTHPGDIGVVVVAAFITLAMVAILLLPSPFAKLKRAQAQQEKIEAAQKKVERQKKIDEAVASGVVTVGIPPTKKPNEK